MSLLDDVNYIFEKKFCCLEQFFPSYLFYFTFIPRNKLVYMLCNIILYWLAILIYYKKLRTSIGYKMFFFLSTFLFFIGSNGISEIIMNIGFTLFLIAMLAKEFFEHNWWKVSVIMTMLASSSKLSRIFLVYFIYLRGKQIYLSFINHKVPILKPLRDSFFTVIQFILLPLSFYFLLILSDLKFRNKWCESSNVFSFGFQSGLIGFDSHKKISPIFETYSTKEYYKNNKYVMDRSIISILNIKHRCFIVPFYTVLTDADQIKYFEIIKIYENDFEDENPRFIKNGDVVRLKSLGNEKFIGFRDPEISLSDNKLFSLTFDDFKDQEDFWKVECSDFLVSREKPVKFFHIKKEMYMGASKSNNTITFHISLYSELKSREFYIIDNINHKYYIEKFKDKKAKEEIYAFPKLPFIKIFLEYLNKQKNPNQNDINNLFTIIKNRKKNYLKFSIIIFFIFQIILSFIFVLQSLFSYVQNIRNASQKPIDSLTAYFLYLFLFSILGFIFISREIFICLYISNIFNSIFIISRNKQTKVKAE